MPESQRELRKLLENSLAIEKSHRKGLRIISFSISWENSSDPKNHGSLEGDQETNK